MKSHGSSVATNAFALLTGENSEKIIEAIRQNPSVTIEELAKITQTTTRSVEKNLKKLKDQNRIARIGAANGGKWVLKN